ncbi:MAG: hypothetical protein H0U86_14630 [Chloroflexi bacterium]|nr:hypothetical protein [Chloroflexota bacterium]
MIGTRGAISAGATLVGLVLLLGPRAADPGIEISAEVLVRGRAQAATDALDALRDAIQPGLDEARLAAAAVLSADDPPGSLLLAAGATIADAEGAATTARRAVARLNGARGTWGLGATPLADPTPASELESIGRQLAAAAPAGDSFADLRERGIELPATLEQALTALEGGDLDTAEEIVAQARADHDLVAAWEAERTTLAVWIATTDAMIIAMEEIVSATRAGDAAAAGAAAERFADLGDEAAPADRALRIALGEGGSALIAAPLERLAAALGGIEDARSATAAIATAMGR